MKEGREVRMKEGMKDKRQDYKSRRRPRRRGRGCDVPKMRRRGERREAKE